MYQRWMVHSKPAPCPKTPSIWNRPIKQNAINLVTWLYLTNEHTHSGISNKILYSQTPAGLGTNIKHRSIHCNHSLSYWWLNHHCIQLWSCQFHQSHFILATDWLLDPKEKFYISMQNWLWFTEMELSITLTNLFILSLYNINLIYAFRVKVNMTGRFTGMIPIRVLPFHPAMIRPWTLLGRPQLT